MYSEKVISVSGTPIWAAGAVPLRGIGLDREVVVAHRPVYDDWVLPKGKVIAGELLPRTAVREVAEEVSALIRLGAPLTPTRYPIRNGTKMVSWWVGKTLTAGVHQPDSEVDKTRWLPIGEASQLLTYADERAVLTEATTLPDSTPLIIVRHAKAQPRHSWKGDDTLRPLESRGKQQLPYLSQILTSYAATTLISSPSVRCVQTFESYASDEGLEMTTESLLSEEQASSGQLAEYMVSLAREVGRSHVPTAICGHRPVIPMMLAPLGVEDRPMSTASCVVIHLDVRGEMVRAEWHDTLRVKVN